MASDQICVKLLSKKFLFISQPKRKSVRRNHLIEIVDKLTPVSTIEDVYAHLYLLADVEESEKQEKEGKNFT